MIIGTTKEQKTSDPDWRNLKYAESGHHGPKACEVDPSPVLHSVIQSSTGSFQAGPNRSFVPQDNHIYHAEAATDALHIAIAASQIEAETTVPHLESTTQVTQQISQIHVTQPVCKQLAHQAQNGAGKICDIEPDHSYLPGNHRDSDVVTNSRLDKTAVLQNGYKKYKLGYRRSSVACGKSLCQSASNRTLE